MPSVYFQLNPNANVFHPTIRDESSVHIFTHNFLNPYAKIFSPKNINRVPPNVYAHSFTPKENIYIAMDTETNTLLDPSLY